MLHEGYISAVVLAAGASTRMGEANKLFLKLGEKSVLRRAVENALKSNVREVLVVAGESVNQVNLELRDLNVRVLMNRNSRRGIGTSIVTGVRALSPHTQAAIILLADQPNLQSGTINRFIRTYERSGRRIVAGQYGGIVGNPVLFDRAFFPELLHLTGDVGARGVVQRHADDVAVVEVPEVRPWMWIPTRIGSTCAEF